MKWLRRIGLGFLGLNVLLMLAGLVARFFIRGSGSEETEEFDLVAIFNGIEFDSRTDAFRAGSALAAFGGIDLDLRRAEIAPGGAYLRLRTIFGGIDVTVPRDWRVDVRGSNVLGGQDSNIDNSGLPLDAPTLTIEASTVMGGVDIHHSPRPRPMARAAV